MAKHIHIHVHRAGDSEQPRDADGKFGSGGGSSGGATAPVTVKQTETPKFVHDFIREHGTQAKMKAVLATRSKEHLQKAHELLSKHPDQGAATNMMRKMVSEELDDRANRGQ